MAAALAALVLAASCSQQADRAAALDDPANAGPRLAPRSCRYAAAIWGGPSGLRYEVTLRAGGSSATHAQFAAYRTGEESPDPYFRESLEIEPAEVLAFCREQKRILAANPPRKGWIVLDPVPMKMVMSLDEDVYRISTSGFSTSAWPSPATGKLIDALHAFLRQQGVRKLPERWYADCGAYSPFRNSSTCRSNEAIAP
ncbi:hypothetical protein I5E68_14160 [Novosphingobium sp. YJ-S2-02]|uniref:Uncharacterized protein n=1 Tax=Novosphingobium aureum TaxID=2792964 RepID=A0A931MM64_9SPHN|nr:hypothetical protein [Novosphingobium aureum]MBH0114085.1 hypothetical protein [Novosphingobium aureum]